MCINHPYSQHKYLPTSPPIMGKTKGLRDQTVEQQKTGIDQKTIIKKLDEMVTVGVILCKWKKYKMAISRPQSGDPMQALASWGEDDYEKCDESAQTTSEQLNDLKAVGTTATKNTTGNMFSCITWITGLKCWSIRRVPHLRRRMYRPNSSLSVNT